MRYHLHCGNDPTDTKHNGMPSATHPPAPHAIPFTLRDDPTVTNHTGILSTAHARKTSETPCIMRNRSDHDPPMIRTWSAHDPTTHETVSHPSHSRGRSSKFVDTLCMEKHRVSCICSLKNAFRARLPSKLHRQLLHQHHLQCHSNSFFD